MKATLLVVMAMFATFAVKAQNTDYKWGVGVQGTFNDYKGDVANDFSFTNFENMGGAISLGRYLNSSFDVVGRLSLFGVESGSNKAGWSNVKVDIGFINATAALKYKFNNGYIFKEDAFLAPYVVLGTGLSFVNLNSRFPGNVAFKDDKEIGQHFYYGAGLNIRINPRWTVNLETSVFYAMKDFYDGLADREKDADFYNDKFLQNSIGVTYNFGAKVDTDGDGVADKRDECPGTPAGVAVDKDGCPVDTDGDGIADYRDACPLLAGTVKGCPDSDRDGVADKDDRCPNVKGVAQFAGCPDTDGDGVQDSEDACPDVRGLKELKGCPDSDGDGVVDSKDKCPYTKPGYKVDANGCALDNDGDGVVNEEDKCPNLRGAKNNYGCPVADQGAISTNLEFATASNVLRVRSKRILNKVAAEVKKYPFYTLKISGYCDSRGSEEYNMGLSIRRAEAAKKFLLAKGVKENQIITQGFGESNPIATNKTAAGRQLNRRVMFELFIK